MLNKLWYGLGITAVVVASFAAPTTVSAKSKLSHGTSKSRMTHGSSRSKMVHSKSHQSSFGSAETRKSGDKDKTKK